MCGLIFLSAVPLDLRPYYPPDYHAPPTSDGEWAAARAHESFKLDLVLRFADGGRLLEVGPGNGAFAHLALEAGFDVEVLELSRHVAERLERTIGVRAIVGEADGELLVEQGPFDVITFWHVVEHVRNPRRLIERCADALGPGGALVVASPNARALQLRLLGARWPHLDAPRHLALIPAPTLVGWAEAAGLVEQARTFTDVGSLRWNEFGWSEFFVRLDPRFLRREPMDFVPRLLRRVGRETARLLAPLERGSDRGTAYTIVFRKP